MHLEYGIVMQCEVAAGIDKKLSFKLVRAESAFNHLEAELTSKGITSVITTRSIGFSTSLAVPVLYLGH